MSRNEGSGRIQGGYWFTESGEYQPLEAAAPHLLAAAWDEGMEAMYASTSSEWPPIPEQNPYRPTP